MLETTRELLKQEKIDGLLLSSSANIAYLTNYFGFSDTEREAYVLITEKQNYLFTDRRYTEAVRYLQDISLQEITSDTPFKKLLKDLLQTHSLKVIGIEEQDLRVKEYLAIKKLPVTIKPITLRTLRIKKTTEEIALIQKACNIGDKALVSVLKTIKEGMTEKEIGNLLEFEIKQQDAGTSFRPIVAFNEHAAIPHHLTSDRRLKKNDLILIDFGAQYKGYCSDMTRTVFFGNPTTAQEKVYQTVLTAQQQAVTYLQNELRNKDSGSAAHADKISREYIESQGYPTIPHSLGHGIGIQVHEAPTLSPKSKDDLTEGMVFSIEPGIYLPGKFGIRIEDLFAIQNKTVVQLTNSSSTLHVVNE